MAVDTRGSRPFVARARLALAAGLALATAACDKLGAVAKPEVPLWVHHPGTALTIESRRELSTKKLDAGEPFERGTPTIDAPHRRVFVGSSDHGLYALSATTLATLWRFETGGRVEGTPLYVEQEDAVYFGSNDGAVYKLRAADGKLVWRFSTNGEVLRRPVLVADTLFAMNANDALVAIHAITGKLRWFRQRPSAAGMEIAGYAAPAVHDGLVYAAFSDGLLLAYRLEDGSEAWSGPVDLNAEAEQAAVRGELRYLDADTTPVVAPLGANPEGPREALFVASYEGGVFALDPRTGGQLWRNDKALGVTELVAWTSERRPTPGSGEPPTARTVLVASSGMTGLWGLEPSDGHAEWRRELPAGGVTPVVPWKQALLVGTTRYGLFLIHPLDGRVLDGIAAGGSFAATPATYGTHAFALSNEGVLLGLGLEPPSRRR
ncbi:MAG: PQQ-binding-like beta-propeller repeat protein [Deltaproteobacteria bacterium]|nr:PQQ-binding-like beta-propeller repeat protein [Deltaproteobacteria bacterium]